ncbi:MAG: GNAT family N-acetyltransferase [Allorhizobium sp.]
MTCMEGPSLRLRPATADDAAARFLFGHNPEIVRMFGVSHAGAKPMTMDAAEAWARAHAANPYVWIIEVGGQLIGEIKLHSGKMLKIAERLWRLRSTMRSSLEKDMEAKQSDCFCTTPSRNWTSTGLAYES